EVLHEVARRTFCECVFRHEFFRRLVCGQRAQTSRKRADRASELERTADVLAMPEGHAPRDPGRGRDEHAILGDLFDAPARRTEKEDVALLRLEDIFLVELADATLALLRAREEHAVQPTVRDRAAVRDRHDLRALARAHDARGPIPDDARP